MNQVEYAEEESDYDVPDEFSEDGFNEGISSIRMGSRLL